MIYQMMLALLKQMELMVRSTIVFSIDFRWTRMLIIHSKWQSPLCRMLVKPRGAYPNPNPDKQPFCVMDMLWHYVTRYPPPADGAFFPNITSANTLAPTVMLAWIAAGRMLEQNFAGTP
jgi:hypothetical protein